MRLMGLSAPPSTKMLRFGLVGILMTLLHVAIARTLIEGLVVLPSPANGVAFTLATLTSYVINTKWSFSEPLHGRNLVRFIQIAGVGLLLSIIISGLADYYGLSYWFGIVFVVVLIPPVTFFLHLKWTYQ